MAQRVKFFLAADNGQCAHFGLDLHLTERASPTCTAAILARPDYAAVHGEMNQRIGVTSRDPASSPLTV
ncbi:hypothetical protein [Bosea sp. MMO-172]|uniref:hypothetical protein n=1 Tax=Bosea sp. MMO-172 TaxID=3127885 RepID=UPI00301A45E4